MTLTVACSVIPRIIQVSLFLSFFFLFSPFLYFVFLVIARSLITRRGAARHPTPRAPLPLPACMTPQKAADGLDGLLLVVGSEAFWGGGGGDDGEAVAKTIEWKSLGQRAVAVESCLFVVQVLKAARRRTIGERGFVCVCVWRGGEGGVPECEGEGRGE